MKKIKKKIALGLAILSLFAMCNFYAAAQEPESIYKETRGQINLRNTAFHASEQDLLIQVDDSNIFTQYFGNKEKEKLDEIIQKYPQIKGPILQKVKQGEEICAIAFTEAPIRIYSDHSERVPKEDKSLLSNVLSFLFPIAQAAQTASGQPAYEAEQNFVLYTLISKQTDGTYIVSSMAGWEKGSFIGGSRYPASGTDYLLQSVPNSFARTGHNFSCLYNTSGSSELSSNAYYGTEGDEFTVTDGGNTYLKVTVKDDPFGMSRLSLCTLRTYQRSSSYSGYRTINSYYVHTWKQMDISVTISANTNKEASLNITPSVTEKSWSVYGYVTFNF